MRDPNATATIIICARVNSAVAVADVDVTTDKMQHAVVFGFNYEALLRSWRERVYAVL